MTDDPNLKTKIECLEFLIESINESRDFFKKENARLKSEVERLNKIIADNFTRYEKAKAKINKLRRAS